MKTNIKFKKKKNVIIWNHKEARRDLRTWLDKFPHLRFRAPTASSKNWDSWNLNVLHSSPVFFQEMSRKTYGDESWENNKAKGKGHGFWGDWNKERKDFASSRKVKKNLPGRINERKVFRCWTRSSPVPGYLREDLCLLVCAQGGNGWPPSGFPATEQQVRGGWGREAATETSKAAPWKITICVLLGNNCSTEADTLRSTFKTCTQVGLRQ